MNTSPFWKNKTLEDLTPEEWELLCDGCARCCLHKLEDPDTGEVRYTAVACRLLDIENCRCLSYSDRRKIVPECLYLNPEKVKQAAYWLPETCAYRLLSEGKPLCDWHPLVSGDPESVHNAGISLRDRAVSEHYVNSDDLEAFVIEWERN